MIDPFTERSNYHLARSGDYSILERLFRARGEYVGRADLGGCAASQAVYRLRNTHGSDIIASIQGCGYRLTKSGAALWRSIDEKAKAHEARIG